MSTSSPLKRRQYRMFSEMNMVTSPGNRDQLGYHLVAPMRPPSGPRTIGGWDCQALTPLDALLRATLHRSGGIAPCALSLVPTEPSLCPRPSQKPGNGILRARDHGVKNADLAFIVLQRPKSRVATPRNTPYIAAVSRRPENLKLRENGWWTRKDSELPNRSL